MNPIARKILELLERPYTRVGYGVMATSTTVYIEGSTTAVPVPVLASAGALTTGDYVSILLVDGDALVLGKSTTLTDAAAGAVELDQTSVTAVTPATNFDATLVMTRYGPWATMLITMERTGVNIGATTAVVATVGTAGRGTFAAFGQALAIRTSAASALADSSIRFNASTGALTAQWHNAWNTGVIVSWSGVVFLGDVA